MAEQVAPTSTTVIDPKTAAAPATPAKPVAAPAPVVRPIADRSVEDELGLGDAGDDISAESLNAEIDAATGATAADETPAEETIELDPAAEADPAAELDPDATALETETPAEAEPEVGGTPAAETTAAAQTPPAGTKLPTAEEAAAAEQAKADEARAQAAETQRQQKFNTDLAKVRGSYKVLAEKVSSGKFDPLHDGDAKVLAETVVHGLPVLFDKIAELEAGNHQLQETHQRQLQNQRMESQWQRWAAENPLVGVAEGKRILSDEYNRLQKLYPNADVSIAAREAFNHKIQRVTAAKKGAGVKVAATPRTAPPSPRPATAGAPRTAVASKPVVTRGGASITGRPAVGGTVPRQPAKSVDEKLARGEYGDLSRIV